MAQADHLYRLQQDARNKHQLKHDEQVAKENFRKRLELFCQKTLAQQYPELDASAVRLKCYGSLNNGFGLAGCDMDLLLALPDGFTPQATALSAHNVKAVEKVSTDTVTGTQDISASEDVSEPAQQESFAIGWLLEGALLDQSLGARLLTKTRVPILKICESPGEDLLKKLRWYRSDQMNSRTPSIAPSVSESTFPPTFDLGALTEALSTLEDQESAAGISLPDAQDQGKKTATDLEFGNDCGIKCDVNFTNDMAMFNTRLLREYCMLDPRVAQVGVFVKIWAKTRDINTPYYGTLSSYGFVLMVLHFLINIVEPPVIPNLQHLAREEDGWNQRESVDLLDGKYDVRFLTDHATITQYRNARSPNKDSIGNLIRGFFWYYSTPNGFNWKNDVISIRTKGGIVKKYSKGWTEAKWSDQADKKNVRLRYLMAIEDPFETEHNVARVVGHHGIVAIRDEFRRAWSIISSVGVAGAVVEDLMEPVNGRGDLLRKDQDHHKGKMRQMRQAAEAKQQELQASTPSDKGQATGQSHANGTSSDSDSSSKPLRPLPEEFPDTEPKLTPWVRTYRDKPRQFGSRRRLVKDDSDDEADNRDDEREHAVSKVEQINQSATHVKEKMPEKSEVVEGTTGAASAELNLAPGFDVLGNPIAWDLGSQEGRWLHWRDNKIRAGKLHSISSNFARVHEACPFDPRRPLPVAENWDRRPPVSMSNKAAGVSTSSNQWVPHPHGRKSSAAQMPEQIDTENSNGTEAGAPKSHQEQPSAAVLDVSASTKSDQPITLPIRYPWFTAGGKWLMKRDAMIRQGTLRVDMLNEWEKQVHDEFPYNPHMTFSQLQELNRKLRNHWRHRPKPIHPGSKPAAVASADHLTVAKPKNSEDDVVTELKELPQQSDRDKHSLPGYTDNVTVSPKESVSHVEFPTSDQPAKPDDNPEEMPNSTFIRSRRLAFFAQQEAEQASSEAVISEKQADTVQHLMRKAGIDIHRPELTKTGSTGGIWAESDSENAATKTTKTGASGQTSFQSNAVTAVERSRSPKSSHAPIDSSQVTDVASEESEKVPATLLPNMSTEERPRDEDPNVMPIPRKLGFKFDVRQLRDLAVIKEGGNGCARAGHEFEIEQDYEWGGGGEMGYRTSSGLQQTSGTSANDMYEYGRGDDEGMLGELPGQVD